MIENHALLAITCRKSVKDGTPSKEDKVILNRQDDNRGKCYYKKNFLQTYPKSGN